MPHDLEPYRGKISKDAINSLPIQRYEGPVHVVRSASALAAALDRLRAERLLGFDTESKPAFRKGATPRLSLLQLASADAVYLFQLRLIPFADRLQAILADPRIIKAGVAVRDDILELQKVAPFTAAGFVDLGDIARSQGIETNGLRNMTANFLGFRLSKTAQRSNWANPELSQRQILYAAADAWAGRELYLRFTELGLAQGLSAYE